MRNGIAVLLGLTLLTGCAGHLNRIPAAPQTTPHARPADVDLPREAVLEFLLHLRATYRWEPAEALAHLRKAALLDPDSAALRIRLAEAYMGHTQLDESTRQCELALKMEPDYCPAHHLLGRIAAYQIDLEPAETHLRRAIECDPGLQEAWLDLVFLLRAQDRYEEQLQLLDDWRPHVGDDALYLRLYGQTLENLGRHEEALVPLREAVELDPEDSSSLAEVLATYLESNRLQESAEFLEGLVKRYPSSLALREELARVYTSLGRYDEVITQILSEYDQDPYSRDLHAYHAASWLERLMRYEEAIDLLERTSEEFPGESMLHLKLGWINETAGNPEAALAAWAKVDRHDVYWSMSVHERARVLHGLDRRDEAISLLTESLDDVAEERGEVDTDLCVLSARLLTGDGRYLEAREALDRFESEDPELYSRQLGRLHWKMGELDRAVVVLEEAINREGVQPDASLELAGLYRSAEMYPEAVAILEACLERLNSPSAEQQLPVGRYPTVALRQAQIQSNKVDILVTLGFLRGLSDDQEGARRAMEEVLGFDPDDTRALNYIGYTYADAGENLEQAEVLIRKALTLQPLDPAILDSLGWVLFRQGRLDEAMETLDAARQRMPESSVIWLHLGETNRELGHADEAITCYQKSIEFVDIEDPEEVYAGQRARKMLQEMGESSP